MMRTIDISNIVLQHDDENHWYFNYCIATWRWEPLIFQILYCNMMMRIIDIDNLMFAFFTLKIDIPKSSSCIFPSNTPLSFFL